MLIMSQYKKMLIPFEMIASLYVDGCEIKIAYLLTYKEDDTIGVYQDEQKAKEVLRLIYNRYERGHKVFEMPEEQEE